MPPGSPPLGASEKAANPARWSDSTAFSHMMNNNGGGGGGGYGGYAAAGQPSPRMGSPPPPPAPQDGNMMFVGYNRHTGAPEFSSELPGDSEISGFQQQGREEARVVGGSPVEMEAREGLGRSSRV